MEALLKSIVSWSLTILTFLAVGYVALQAAAIYFGYRDKDINVSVVIGRFSEVLSTVIINVWNVVSPIIRFSIIISVIYYFAKSSGILQANFLEESKVDSKSVLAFFVVGTFSVAALMSRDPASWLKDIALVAIGFYFGTQAGH